MILDDAYHFLKYNSLNGRHLTATTVPSIDKDIQLPIPGSESPRIFVWSSADEGGISRATTAYHDYLAHRAHPELESVYLDDLASTLATKRTVFPYKSFTVARSLPELVGNLANGQSMSKAVRSTTIPKIGFVFTGQGAQWFAMGRELLSYAPFRLSMQDASSYMATLNPTFDLMGRCRNLERWPS